MHKHSASMFALPTALGTPSLDSKVTTAASSFDNGVDYEYDWHTRPLQSRRDPVYAVSVGARSEELVTPFIPPPPSTLGEAMVEENLWAKKAVVKGKGAGKDGLAKLLGGTSA
jgi:hypothetical protein